MTITITLSLPALAQDEQSKPAVPQKATVFEDGNSYFHTDLFAKMNDMERAHYSVAFVQAIVMGQTGKNYAWEMGRIKGEIMLTADPFQSRSKVTCRRFQEWYQLDNIRQTFKGITCQQRGGGFCKLYPESIATCELKAPGGLDGIIFGIQQWWRGLFNWL